MCVCACVRACISVILSSPVSMVSCVYQCYLNLSSPNGVRVCVRARVSVILSSTVSTVSVCLCQCSLILSSLNSVCVFVCVSVLLSSPISMELFSTCPAKGRPMHSVCHGPITSHGTLNCREKAICHPLPIFALATPAPWFAKLNLAIYLRRPSVSYSWLSDPPASSDHQTAYIPSWLLQKVMTYIH